MLIRTRRDFMKAAVTGMGALGGLAKLGELNALASVSSNYKALVCIFLAGGNDSHNMVVPVSTALQNYNTYAQGRQGLALPQAGLQMIHNGADAYGLHPLMPELAALYTAGNAAVVANVGMLVQQNTTRATFQSQNLAMLPPQLFSHSDQTNQWQAAVPSTTAFLGWGGQVEDKLASFNTGAAFSPITSTSGCGLFCVGQNTSAATVPVGGASLLQGATSSSRLTAVNALMNFDNGLKLVTAANGVFNRGVGFSQALNAALATAQINTPFPSTLIGAQLQTVARIISIQSALSINRQVFFCQLGGFDTHGSQSGAQDPLMQQLSQAVGAFYTALSQEVGADKQTLTFTASEFGRTLQPNGNAGTDHGWGSHHLVVGAGVNNGGALRGGQFAGQFPSLALGGPDDANTRGTLVPTTSVDQYAATMALWFGLDPSLISTVFPNVQHFTSYNLGFLG